ncbi:MAG: sigma 54-interacting transcriptional regulator [Myxococcota bacterium]
MAFDEETLTTTGEMSLGYAADGAHLATLRRVFDGATRAVRAELLPLARVVPIGRAVTGPETICLPDDHKVSREHALLTTDVSGEVRLKNLSRNGTRVNGVRVDDTVVLHDNDIVRVGDSCFVFRRWSLHNQDAEVPGLIGSAQSISQLRSTLALVGPSDTMVLLLGETGVGKDVAARGLHALSGRHGPLVTVNCGAIPENLAESQLFGHRKGAFTGAQEDRVGFLRQAHGGTLFLDEVGELPLALQPKLLRVLDSQEVIPVGATTGFQCNTRVIAATNRDLLAEVRRGNFRADLYARLAEITVRLPPLRERREDILALVHHSLGADAPAMKASLAEALLLHDWPFNVREAIKLARELQLRGAGMPALDLSLVAERLSAGPPVESSSTGPEASGPAPRAASVTPAAPPAVPAPTAAELMELLARHDGKIAQVAKATGRSRTQVYRWIEQHGINLEGYRTV